MPAAADADENRIITRARQLLGAYDRAELMVQSGLYAPGSDPVVDAAVSVLPGLDAFIAAPGGAAVQDSFAKLRAVLETATQRASSRAVGTR